MERSTIFHGEIHYTWWFSIVMLNYQRVCFLGGGKKKHAFAHSIPWNHRDFLAEKSQKKKHRFRWQSYHETTNCWWLITMNSPWTHHEITMKSPFVKPLFTAMVSPWILQRCSEESKCKAQLQQAAPAQTWWLSPSISPDGRYGSHRKTIGKP